MVDNPNFDPKRVSAGGLLTTGLGACVRDETAAQKLEEHNDALISRQDVYMDEPARASMHSDYNGRYQQVCRYAMTSLPEDDCNLDNIDGLTFYEGFIRLRADMIRHCEPDVLTKAEWATLSHTNGNRKS
ncbi:MAG: hypothetical protein Q7T11_02110 [Deltaproteobacteria bacterium]|nr:hypothetical protein [Deltaproteobacteria bacterium]